MLQQIICRPGGECKKSGHMVICATKREEPGGMCNFLFRISEDIPYCMSVCTRSFFSHFRSNAIFLWKKISSTFKFENGISYMWYIYIIR
jgi:hypothetical protein